MAKKKSKKNIETLTLDMLKSPKGAKTNKTRKGRGASSGKGRSSGRGRGGSGHRSGMSMQPGFEGGQMPLIRRVPKRGFSNKKFSKDFEIVNVNQIQENFRSGEKVDPDKLKKKGLVKGKKPVKILGKGEIKKKIKVSDCRLSKGALNKIEKAGGTVE